MTVTVARAAARPGTECRVLNVLSLFHAACVLRAVAQAEAAARARLRDNWREEGEEWTARNIWGELLG